MDTLLRQWNETYFDNQLAPAVLAIFDALALSTQSETVKGVLERQCRAMKQSHFQATDFTDDFARNLYAVLNVFAKSWNGTPPPLTLPGRHVKLDTYVTCNSWRQFPPSGTFLDVGCGFPPLTTVETAQTLPDWRVIGADPVIPHWIVYDEQVIMPTLTKLARYCTFKARVNTLAISPKTQPAQRPTSANACIPCWRNSRRMEIKPASRRRSTGRDW